ncbi:hypothetical protein EDB89DRAFT_1901976 [Lactarius sanguifluus]|nr:hypothetical protein EDB89DRAFT_1901976 [Lactarius sanguifluus]
MAMMMATMIMTTTVGDYSDEDNTIVVDVDVVDPVVAVDRGGHGGGGSRGAGGGCCCRVRTQSFPRPVIASFAGYMRTGLRAATLNTTTSNSKTATPWATRQQRSDTHQPWHQGDVLPRPQDDAHQLQHNTVSINHDDRVTRQWDDVNRQQQQQEDANDNNDGSNDGNCNNDNRQLQRQLGWWRALL